MKLESLHLIEFQSNSSILKQIKAIVRATHAFRASTCRRHVLIFYAISDHAAFSEALAELKAQSLYCHHLSGYDAYSFLLSWAVGGEYRCVKGKLPLFNDRHVLGKILSNWNEFKLVCQAEFLSNFSKLMDPLFEDAHNIRGKVEARHYGSNHVLRATLDQVIANIIFSRRHSLPVNYENMHVPRSEYILILRQSLRHYMTRLQNVLNANGGDHSALTEGARRKIYNKLILCIWGQRFLRAQSCDFKAEPKPELRASF